MKRYLVLLAGGLLATTAFAGGDKDHSMKSADQKFEQLDSDQSSSISMSEASQDEKLSATFAAVDADGDGELSQTEYTAHVSESESGNEAGEDWSSSTSGDE
jgi:Ca2+-binding EF-hand superfamily protein